MDTKLNNTVSVALCTYNGERFLPEQLESIATQTVLPFELVICDDVSSDATGEILKNFAATAKFPVHLHFNSKNLGYVKNFEKAISLCIGDIIFLSDQDDRWRSDKIAVQEKNFVDANVGMAFSNARVVDANGLPTGKSLWDEAHFDGNSRDMFYRGKAYQELYLKNIVSGCTMAFRKEWWPFIRPLPEGIPFIHDAWIAFMVSLVSEVIPINLPLIEYRVHTQQSTAVEQQKVNPKESVRQARRGGKKQHYKKHLLQLQMMKDRNFNLQDNISTEKKQYLAQCMAEHEIHLRKRVDSPRNEMLRIFNIGRELSSGRYHQFSNGFKSAVADLLERPK